MMIRTRFTRRLILIVLSVLFEIEFCWPQQKLRITFEETSIVDTTVFQGLPAGFPFPVLSLISVRSPSGLYIQGLADTSRWLGVDDLTRTGRRVGDVWKQILDFHTDNPTVPANADVKTMTPGFLVTEVRNVEGFGISVALVMDYSFSMGDDKQVADEAARIFIRQKHKQDRAALSKFNGKVFTNQTFTSDTSALLAAVDIVPEHFAGTALYDAIYNAITMSQDEPWRRAVIAYTDGRDNASVKTIEDVIDYAKDEDVPIFTIGLGNKIEKADLVKIAQSTGGIYREAPDASGLSSIYLAIYGLLKGYYVLAHTSTDPFYNGTWRTISLTLNHEGVEGLGVGSYFVPFVPPDVSIRSRILSDSMVVEDGDTLAYAEAESIVQFEIRVENVGQGPVSNIRVVDFLPDTLHFLSAQPEPESAGPDSLVWRIPRLDENTAASFVCHAVVDTHLTPLVFTKLIHVAVVRCANDGNIQNNQSCDTLRVRGHFPPPPEIRISPMIVEPDDPVAVEVRFEAPINSWDILIRYEDGSCVTSYADPFIHSSEVAARRWIQIQPLYDDTRMRTDRAVETVEIILQTVGVWGEVDGDTACFSIQSTDDFLLDENVFRPAVGPLGMRYKLSSNRSATLIVYDLAGAYIKQVVEGTQSAGWNTVVWDGRDEKNRMVGSGLYVAILRSGGYIKAHKFLVVR